MCPPEQTCSKHGKELTNQPFLETKATISVTIEKKDETTLITTAAATDEDKPTIETQKTTIMALTTTEELKPDAMASTKIREPEIAASPSVALPNIKIQTMIMSSAIVTPVKHLVTSSQSMPIFGATSENLNQEFKSETSQIITEATILLSKPLDLAFSSVTATKQDSSRMSKAALTSSSLSLSLEISRSVKSSRAMNILTSYQIPRSSPLITSLPLLQTAESKAAKSTLIVSSSQLADEMSSSASAVTSSETLPTSKEVKVNTTETAMKSSGISSSTSADVTTASANAAVEHSTSKSVSHHPTHPTDHGDTHSTHPPHPKDTSHSNTTGHGKEGVKTKMPPPEEGDAEASTGVGGGGAQWVVSIIVVFALMGGMIAFVIVFVLKDRARTREKNLSDMKRPGIGGDHGFMPLKEIKTEGEPAKLTKAEKRQSERNSHYGNPEDAVPLLELHIAGDGHSVLNANDETQAESNGNTATKKPFLDVYADGSKKSLEKLNSPRFI